MGGCAVVVTITQVQKYPFLRYINVPRRQCPRHRVRRLFRRRRPFRHLRLPGKAQQQSKHIILCRLRYVVYYYYIRIFVCVVYYPAKMLFFIHLYVLFLLYYRFHLHAIHLSHHIYIYALYTRLYIILHAQLTKIYELRIINIIQSDSLNLLSNCLKIMFFIHYL